MKTETKLVCAFLLAVGVVLAVAALTYLNSRALVRRYRQVVQTYQLIGRVDEVLGAALNAETGVRSFALTGDDAALPPYEEAAAALPGLLAGLHAALPDDPDQVLRANQLDQLARRRLALAAQGLAWSRRNRPAPVPPELRQASNETMTALRRVAAEMKTTEQERARRRSHDSERSARNVGTAFAALLFLAVLLLALLYTLVRNDLEERRRIGGLVEASEHKFRALLEFAPDAMAMTDSRGVILLVNSAFEVLFDRPRAAALGRPLGDYLVAPAGGPAAAGPAPAADGRGDDRAAGPGPADQAVPAGADGPPNQAGDQQPSTADEGRPGPPASTLGGSAVRLSTRYEDGLPPRSWQGVRPDGTRFPVEITQSPLPLVSGKEPARLTAIRDHSARQRAEDQLRAFSRDLARSNAELERFAYVASHDLQEPLRMVSSYTQLLARRYRGKLDPNADEFIAYAVDGASRMQNLINDLLAYSRVGTKGKNFARVDCEAVLRRVLRDSQETLTQRGATVVRPEPLPEVLGDEGQIGQLFQNLVGNAAKFSRPGVAPRLEITAGPEPGQPDQRRFSFRDNGIGIDPRYFERIFVVFQRLHPKEQYPGTGIGLAICKKIVERHGGRLWVESRPGEGADFQFVLPAAPAAPAGSAPDPPPPAAAGSAGPAGPAGTVLAPPPAPPPVPAG